MNCDNLDFSFRLSNERIQQANAIFGAKIIQILAWALFLLGANKPSICSALSFKEGSLRTLLFRLKNQGLGVLEDRRTKASSFKTNPLPNSIVEPTKVTLSHTYEAYQICFGSESLQIQIPNSNPVLLKAMLLCLLNSHILNRKEVAQALRLSEDRVAKLVNIMCKDDIHGILDQRNGQKQDYVYTPEVKGELIQQFVIDLVQDGKTSGENLSKHIEERCQFRLSPRSILHHLNILGLSQIKSTLPNHLEALKKTL